MRIIVGLGNPGKEYAQTRHNVGKGMVDYLVQKMRLSKVSSARQVVQYSYDKGFICKTECFMNISSRPVMHVFNDKFDSKCTERSQHNLCIICDDMEQPLGKVKLKQGGSHKGHNGIKSILNGFRQQNTFYRLQIGIGRPTGKGTIEDYVLG